MLVLCVTPQERERWVRLCKQTGRRDSLFIFGRDQPWRFNFLDYEWKAGNRNRLNIQRLFSQLMAMRQRQTYSGERDPYFRIAAEELLHHATTALGAAYDRLCIEEIKRMIDTAPRTMEERHDPAWQKDSFCYQTLRIGQSLPKDQQVISEHDLGITRNYWLESFPREGSERRRDSVIATLESTLQPFRSGLLHELFCQSTTITPEFTHCRWCGVD